MKRLVLILTFTLVAGISTQADAATNKFYKPGRGYRIEYPKYKKIEGHEAFAITRYYERSGRWSQACGVGWATTEEEAIERALAECRAGAKKVEHAGW